MNERMRRLGFWIAVLWTALASSSVSAGDRAVVVELFTSQGCSSCPPADAVLSELGAMDDVIPLALHVDYWDYIGWKDRFATPGFTARQKGYAHTLHWRVYTPQMVIGGVDDVVGSRAMKVADLIRKHAARPASVDLSISRRGGNLSINARTLQPMSRPCEVYLVRYQPRETVPIESGENAGRELTYTHIVRDWDRIGVWDGQGPFSATVPIQGDEPVVVLMQEQRYGPIVAAARLR